MHNLYDNLTDICEVLSDELSRANDKLSKVGSALSSSDLDYIDKLTHAIKSVNTTKAMLDTEHDGYSRSYRPRYSYDDYSYKRDSMGRYSRDDEYSKHIDGTIMELKEAMDKAPDERSRMMVKELMDKMQNL